LDLFLARIGASAGFARSERLTRFLRFVAEETLAGRGERLKEYTIAIEVYGCPPSYDPQVDSLVRVQAVQLRSRLEHYYAAEGQRDPVRIEIPKGGYQARFVPVTEVTAGIAMEAAAPMPSAAAPKMRGRWRTVAAAAVATVMVASLAAWILSAAHRSGGSGSRQAVAVLPFTDVSPGGNQAPLGDGLAENLIQTLGRVSGLRVVARGSAFKYRRATDMRRIGDALQVQSVVTGTVRRDGSNLRVRAELVRASDGLQLWGATYDRHADDLFTLEQEIAQAIAASLRAERRFAGVPRGAAPAPEAYRRYLTGRYWRISPTLTNLHRALAEFTAATAADPGYAKAYAGIAEAYARIYFAEIVSTEAGAATMEDALSKARAFAAKALDLDGMLSDAHEASALVHIIDWDPTGAEREYRRALELDPANVRARFAYAQLCLNPAQRFDEAARQLLAALEVDPVSLNLITELGATYRLSGQEARAREFFWRSLDLDPQAFGTRTNLAVADAAQGRFADAVARLEAVNADDPGDAWIMGHLGYAYGKAGRSGEARRTLAALCANSTAALHIAAVYEGLGEDEQALGALEQGVSARSPSLLWLRTDFRFAKLQSQPRYTALLARVPR
jgi:serine/threonine-protein kinase